MPETLTDGTVAILRVSHDEAIARRRVKVAWHSRLLDVMANGFIYLSMVPLFLLFLAFAWKTRLGFALILTAVIGVVWATIGLIAILIVARIFSAIFGNEFDTDACIALADKIQQFPLPHADLT